MLINSLPIDSSIKIKKYIEEICLDIVPKWFSYAGAKFDSPEDILHSISSTLKALCENPHNNSNQWEFVKYWGNAVYFTSPEEDGDDLPT